MLFIKFSCTVCLKMSWLCKAESRCTAVALYCSRINGRESSVLSRPVNSQGERHVFPSDWPCTSWVGVNFTGPYTEVVDHIGIAIPSLEISPLSLLYTGEDCTQAPWVLPDSAHCVEALNCLSPSWDSSTMLGWARTLTWQGPGQKLNCNKVFPEGD